MTSLPQGPLSPSHIFAIKLAKKKEGRRSGFCIIGCIGHTYQCFSDNRLVRGLLEDLYGAPQLIDSRRCQTHVRILRDDRGNDDLKIPGIVISIHSKNEVKLN